MGIYLNEKTFYFSKSSTCFAPSFHSLGIYFPQGSLVLFSQQISAQEQTWTPATKGNTWDGPSGMRSCWCLQVFSLPLLFWGMPLQLLARRRKGCFSCTIQPAPSVSGQIVLACFGTCALLPSTDSAGSWSTVTPGCRHRAGLPPSTLYKVFLHTHLCVFSSSHTHWFISLFQAVQYILRLLLCCCFFAVKFSSIPKPALFSPIISVKIIGRDVVSTHQKFDL